jgi:hypothetical protein
VAVIVQVPAPLKLAVFPITAQTPALVVLNVTGRPELAAALRLTVPPTLWNPVIPGNESVCTPAPTAIVAVTVWAAAYVTPSPGCDAKTRQVPTLRKLAATGAAAPDKVQTPGVTELRLTVNPELADAVSTNGLATAALLGGTKVIVCGVFPTATFNNAEALVTPFRLAVIFVVPCATPLAKPAALIVAVVGVPEIQAAVEATFDIVPSL